MPNLTNILPPIIALLLTTAILYLNLPNPGTSNLTTETLQCLDRKTVQSRAQDWIDKKVPYSQTTTHEGYRMDCSGYVSMSWELAKPGLTTQTMHTASHSINKDQLTVGDAMNCESYHVLLFMGWSDSSKTHYIGLEESSSANCTVKRITPYPYWTHTDCFHPIRYHNIC